MEQSPRQPACTYHRWSAFCWGHPPPSPLRAHTYSQLPTSLHKYMYITCNLARPSPLTLSHATLFLRCSGIRPTGGMYMAT